MAPTLAWGRLVKAYFKACERASTWSSCRPAGNAKSSARNLSSHGAWRGTNTEPASICAVCFCMRRITPSAPRRLCEEVHLNLAHRWFCRLGLDGQVPDHSTFSRNRHGRFRDSNILRHAFETVVRRCMAEGLVGGEGFAVYASLNPGRHQQ